MIPVWLEFPGPNGRFKVPVHKIIMISEQGPDKMILVLEGAVKIDVTISYDAFIQIMDNAIERFMNEHLRRQVAANTPEILAE